MRSCIGSPHAGPTHGGAPSRTTPLAPANNAYAAQRIDGPARHPLPPRSRPVRPANRTRSARPEPMMDRSRIRSRAGAHRRRLVGARLVTSGTVGKSARRIARVGPGVPLDWLGRGRSGGRAGGSRAGFGRRGRGRLGRPPGRRGAASALRLRPTLGRPTELVQLVLGPAPAAIAARGGWSYALLALGDVPVGGGPCLNRRVDRSRGLGEVVDPVDLRLQELAGGRGCGARVRCHALAHAPHVTGGSGAPAPGPVGGGDIGDETGRGVGRRPGSLMARAAASASSRRPARDSRPVSRSWSHTR